MCIKKYVFILLSVFSGCLVQAQNSKESNLDQLAGQLVRNIRSRPSESIFVQTDKLLYPAGGNIWFSAYLLDAYSHKITTRSKILYVDLVNAKDSVISQLLLNAGKLKMTGNIPLPADLSDGFYWLRAYTRSILQEDSNAIFVQPLFVIKGATGGEALKQIAAYTKAEKPGDTTIEIYPEGGAVISGINSVIAFKITDAQGNPVSMTGYVKDSRDSVIARLSGDQYGRSAFTFFPWANRTYTAYFQGQDQHIFRVQLPRYNPYAAQLAIETAADGSRQLRVMMEDSLSKINRTTYVIGLHGDSVCLASVGNGLYEINIPEYHFPAGKTTFLLFDQNYRLLSERTAYFESPGPSLTLTPDKADYAAREKANLTVSVTVSGKPEQSLFSLAVTDSSLSIPGGTVAISKNDFQGDPGFYDQLPDPEKDLFMLTDQNSYGELIKPAAGLSEEEQKDSTFYISGHLLNSKNMPVDHAVVTIFSKTAATTIQTDTTDKNGTFCFPFESYDNGTIFQIQAATRTGVLKDADFELNKFEFPVFKTPLNLKATFAVKNYLVHRFLSTFVLDSSDQSKFLPPVQVKSKIPRESHADKRFSSLSEVTSMDFSTGGANRLLDGVLSLPGVTMTNGAILIRGGTDMASATSTLGNNEPMILLDGIQMSGGGNDVDILNSIDPSTVDFIELLSGPDAAQFGVKGSNGVIMIYSKNKSEVSSGTSRDGIRTVIARGFYKAVPFQFPDYAKKDILKNKATDNRSTIYWNGNLLTDSTGKAVVSFYTADLPAIYSVTIRGITQDGAVLFGTFSIRRK